jgi:hypothetical protein
MTLSRLVLAGAAFSILVAGTGISASAASIDCSGRSVCRDLTTRFALRVLPRTSLSVYAKMATEGATVAHRAEAFAPLYVFNRIDVSRTGTPAATGWYHVGLTPQQPIGYVRAADAIEWRVPLLAGYAGRGKGRDRVAYFESVGRVETVMGGSAPTLHAGELSQSKERAQAAGVVAREPEGISEGRRPADLLPVIQSVDVEAYGIKDGWLLQVALPAGPGMGLGQQLCPPKSDCRTRPASNVVERIDPIPTLEPRASLAWAVDFDLAKRERKSLSLHVLLMRSQLLDLKAAVLALHGELQMVRLDAWLQRGPRGPIADDASRGSPPTPEQELKLDQLRIELDRPLADMLPAWLTGLPHRSDLAGVTKRQLGALSAANQARIESRLLELANRTKLALVRPELWLSPTGTDTRDDDHLIVWPLANLP